MKIWLSICIIGVLLASVSFLSKVENTFTQEEAWHTYTGRTFSADFLEKGVRRETGIHEFSLGTTYVSETFSTTEFSVTVRYLPDSVLLNGADVLLPYFLTQNEGEIVYAKRGVYEGGQSIDFLFENGTRGRIILTDRALYELYGREGDSVEHFLNSLSIH